MLWIRKIIEKKPKNLKKILIFSFLILFLIVFAFFPNVAFADWASWLVENDLYAKELSEIIGIISHIVYVFIWPCLAIAGSALDNSLIYGSFLHLDVALWHIWNIMKNFANFTLWFIFVFTIVKNLFAWSFGSSTYDPVKWAKDTIVKTLIAWVLVQMSRFLVAALIDLSTILIYAVWWIPLSMIWTYDNTRTLDIPIMKLNTEFNNNDVSYYYSYSWYNFSTCFLANKDWDVDDKVPLQWLDGKWAYIAWRKYLYKTTDTVFETWYCVLNGYLYKYQESTWFFCDLPGWTSGSWCYEKTWGSLSLLNSDYLNQLKLYLLKLSTWAVLWARDSCFLVNAYNIDYDTWSCEVICPDYWEVSYTGDILQGWFKLKELMENSKWRVWPFVTMYSSILNYQDLVIDPGNKSTMWNLFGLIINTFFALVLFIPIAILMVLLIIRIWYLWVVIAISPIIVLVNFGLDDKIKNKFKTLSEKFSISEIIKLIFSPVIVVFTVSLCLVFLSTIYKSRPNTGDESQLLNAFWIEKVGTGVTISWDSGGWTGSCTASWSKNVSNETYSILWLVTVKLNAQNYNHWKSMFAWVLEELIATWMVRFFMKFAIWAMWKKWEELMKSAEWFIKSVPIIPLPGGKWAVGLGKIGEMAPSAVMDRFSSEMDRESEENIRDAFSWAYPWSHNKSSQQTQTTLWGVSSESIDKVVTEIRDKDISKYVDLSDTSKSTLTTMYGKDAESNFDNFKDYYVTNGDKNKLLIDTGNALSSSSATTETNADALKFNSSDMGNAIKYDPNWVNWLNNMKWKFVELKDKVYIVSQDWKSLQTIQQYETGNFGKELKDITPAIYAGFDNDKKQLLQSYISELLEEIKALSDLTSKETQNKWLQGSDADRKRSLINSNLPDKATVDGYKTTLWIS